MNGLGVLHAHEFRAHDILESADCTLLNALVEERHIVLPLLEHGLEYIFDQVLRQRGVVSESREGDFRLDHPELGQVTAGVRILRTKRGAERIYVGEREAVGLDVELPGYGQKR